MVVSVVKGFLSSRYICSMDHRQHPDWFVTSSWLAGFTRRLAASRLRDFLNRAFRI
jgi:hypothetical protein